MSVSESGEDMRVDLRVLLGALWSRWLRVVLVTLLLLGATFAVMLFVPKVYESTASILVEERSNAFTRAAGEQPPSSAASTDALLLSQIELIKSRDTLLSVVNALNLREVREFNGASSSPLAMLMQLLGARSDPRGGDERVLENLDDRLTVGREGNSSVISIHVRSTNPILAADIANAIADAHVTRRAGLSLSDTAEASGWLETEISKLRTRVQGAESAVANYRADNDLFLSGTGTSSILDQQLSNIATQITSAQERKNAAESRANLIRGLIRNGQPIDGVADVRDSLFIQNLVQSKAALQGELAQRSSTLLANHPTIKALRAQITAIDQEIAAEGRKVADALDSQARVELALEQTLNQDLARLKTSVSQATRDSVELASLEREANGPARSLGKLSRPLFGCCGPHRCELGAARRARCDRGSTLRQAGRSQYRPGTRGGGLCCRRSARWCNSVWRADVGPRHHASARRGADGGPSGRSGAATGRSLGPRCCREQGIAVRFPQACAAPGHPG